LKKSQAIALKILRHIRANGISQKDLAERLNVAPQQVNRWVKGGENFTLETISKIENALDIQLINIVDTPQNNETNNVVSLKKENVFEYEKSPIAAIV
jgi:transcriptional regulator with XRE-family HTH domain